MTLRFRHVVLIIVVSMLVRVPIEQVLTLLGVIKSDVENVAMIVQYVVMILLGMLLARHSGAGLPRVWYGGRTWVTLSLGCICGVALIMCTLGINSVIVYFVSKFNLNFAYEFWGFHTGEYYVKMPFLSFIILIIAHFFMAAIAEEYIFRGLMLRSLQGLGYIKSIVLVSIVFSVLHIGKDAVGAFVFSALLCSLYIKSKSILLVITAHGVYNISAYVVSYKWQFYFMRPMNNISHISDWGIEIVMLIISVAFMLLLFSKIALSRSVWKSITKQGSESKQAKQGLE